MPVSLSRAKSPALRRRLSPVLALLLLAAGTASAAETSAELIAPRQTLRQLWTFNLDDPITGMWLPPHELREKIPYLIVLDATNTVTAFNIVIGADNAVVDTLTASGVKGVGRRHNGEPAWRTRLGEAVVGDPAFTDRGIYFSLAGSRLLGLDPATGEQFWRLALEFPPSAGPAVREGAAEFEESDADMIDAATRAQREADRGQRGNDLFVLLPGIDYGIHALGVDSKMVDLREGQRNPTGNKLQLRTNTINKLWRHPTAAMVAGKPLELKEGVIFYTEKTGRPRGVRRERGGHLQVFGNEKMQMPVASGPVLAGNDILQAGLDGSLYSFSILYPSSSFDQVDMTQNWRRPLGGPLHESPLVVNDEMAFVKVTGGPLLLVLVGEERGRGQPAWRLSEERTVVARLWDKEAQPDRRALYLTLSNDGKSLTAIGQDPMTRDKKDMREVLEKRVLKEMGKDFPEAARRLTALLDSWNGRGVANINVALWDIQRLLVDDESANEVLKLLATFLGGWEVWRIPLSVSVDRFVTQAETPIAFLAKGSRIYAVSLRQQ